MLDYFDNIEGPKKHVWLVHGEPSRSEALREALAARHSGKVEVAELGETVEVR
ncbi:MAG: MBL fold metallo-hydrolase RNA specificity domain-containing protein [Verrucomicrobiales bacterium]